jgi:ATP-dependent DNA helicase RecG
MFYLLGEIEKYGTGFIRIRKILKKHKNIKFNIKEQGHFFIAELITTPVTTP